MESSLWSTTLADLRENVQGANPVPAGVAITAVTGSLALALLAKVLEIVRGRKDFSGDSQELNALLETAGRESTVLASLADEDVRAFTRYMECHRRNEPTDQAMRDAIKVPLAAARAAVRGLDLCREAAPVCSGMTASDPAIAALLLSGVLRAMLLSVEANLQELSPDDPFRAETAAELASLRLLVPG